MFEPSLATKDIVTTKRSSVSANALHYLELAESPRRSVCIRVHIP